MKDAVKPVMKAGRTNAQISNQGFTYNQSGFTYNQAGWTYGGLYEHDIVPLISKVTQNKTLSFIKTTVPKMNIGRTNVQIEDQGYTYNQSGFSYNESGWMYGGIFGHDIYPLIARAIQEKPSLRLGMDFGATVLPPPPSGNSGMLIGMLGLTYP